MEYYNLNQLLTSKLTNLKIRQLKKRIKEVNKLGLDSNLLYKKNNGQWSIHYSIIYLFQLKRNKNTKLRTELTINLEDNYDKDYYTQIAKDIAKLDKRELMFVIEDNYKDENHIHFALATTTNQTKHILSKLDLIRGNIIVSNKNTHIAKIESLENYLTYINKQYTATKLNS